jgi:hypothetical protein
MTREFNSTKPSLGIYRQPSFFILFCILGISYRITIIIIIVKFITPKRGQDIKELDAQDMSQEIQLQCSDEPLVSNDPPLENY